MTPLTIQKEAMRVPRSHFPPDLTDSGIFDGSRKLLGSLLAALAAPEYLVGDTDSTEGLMSTVTQTDGVKPDSSSVLAASRTLLPSVSWEENISRIS